MVLGAGKVAEKGRHVAGRYAGVGDTEAQKALADAQALLHRRHHLALDIVAHVALAVLAARVAHHEAVDQRFERIVAALIKLELVAEVVQRAVDVHAPVAARSDLGEQEGVIFAVHFVHRRQDLDR